MHGHRCSRNFLFRLDPALTGISQQDLEVKTLGKLEIKWRTGFGEIGRLQTQQIQGQNVETDSPDEIVGRIVSSTVSEIVLYHPFDIVVHIKNFTEDTVGPIVLTLHRKARKCVSRRLAESLLGSEGGEVENSALRMSGAEGVRLGELLSGESREVSVSLVSFRSGIQTISNLRAIDETTGSVVGTVDSRDIFVAPCETTLE